jgi:chromosome segregation ATPase
MTEENNLPAVMSESPDALEASLKKIEKHLNQLMEQQGGVSAEFNALMDGYVNKANESQEYKVKYEQLNSQYEEFRLEFKTLKEENKKFRSELESAREALRSSEADLQRQKKEVDVQKKAFEEQISEFVEERERLKSRLKQLTDFKEKSSADYNKLKSELLELQFSKKQSDQERQVAVETADRAVKESSKAVDELKEKLELRTREIEYKDALLNQLIKQISEHDSLQEAMTTNLRDLQPSQPLKESVAYAESPAPEPDPGRGFSLKNKLPRSWGVFKN